MAQMITSSAMRRLEDPAAATLPSGRAAGSWSASDTILYHSIDGVIDIDVVVAAMSNPVLVAVWSPIDVSRSPQGTGLGLNNHRFGAPPEMFCGTAS